MTSKHEVDQVVAQVPEFVADRAFIFRSADALLRDLGHDTPDVMDTLSVAEFLAGDNMEGSN